MHCPFSTLSVLVALWVWWWMLIRNSLLSRPSVFMFNCLHFLFTLVHINGTLQDMCEIPHSSGFRYLQGNWAVRWDTWSTVNFGSTACAVARRSFSNRITACTVKVDTLYSSSLLVHTGIFQTAQEQIQKVHNFESRSTSHTSYINLGTVCPVY